MRTMMRVLAVGFIGAITVGTPTCVPAQYYPPSQDYDTPRDYDAGRDYDVPRDYDSPRRDYAMSVDVPPPPLPVYEQPTIPGPGLIWVPGYWAWTDFYTKNVFVNNRSNVSYNGGQG